MYFKSYVINHSLLIWKINKITGKNTDRWFVKTKEGFRKKQSQAAIICSTAVF